MSFRPDLLVSLTRVLNFGVIMLGLAFLYLVVGENLIAAYQNQPVPMERKDYQPGGAGAATGGADEDRVVNGVHVQSGLIFAEGFEIVRGTCTACHSAKLVTQNRATREGWEEMIRWMQAKQGLWELGANEPIILDYLSKHYAPENTGRRANIDVDAIEWYVLDLEENEGS